MTNKVYRTAGGKTVDMGSLLLQNEEVRAVGNMRVNARGDALDSNNKIIDQKNRQITRQTRRQTNVNSAPVHSSNRSARAAGQDAPPSYDTVAEEITKSVVPAPVKAAAAPAPVETAPATASVTEPMQGMGLKGGLAAAIARSREINQEPLKTPRQVSQEKAGVRKF
jgi:hypothetical protein